MEALRLFKERFKNGIRNKRRWTLTFYDVLLLLLVELMILGVFPSSKEKISLVDFLLHTALYFICVYSSRCGCSVYRQVWRYGGASAYIRLIMSDMIAGVVYFILQEVLPIHTITFIRAFSIAALNLLMALGIRLLYQFLYETAKSKNHLSGFAWKLFSLLSDSSISAKSIPIQNVPENVKIKIAIVGAGNIGALLAEELLMNPRAAYMPCCFIEIDRDKIGREVMGIPVIASEDVSDEMILKYGIQEIVFALPQIEPEQKKDLYDFYSKTGCKMKTYDYPMMQNTDNSKRSLREFNIEELLFRRPVIIGDEKTKTYYKDKVVMITGGGGSIGSELCRQIATMQPKTLVILDVYENGAYDVQQELKIAYGGKLDVRVEIVSICDVVGFEKIIATYKPDVILHAAAHKHVPLMEHNCCEAVKNNVFGTLNAVELAVKYKVSRFIMITTDKAVNPTNVMGATKRMCEMIIQSYSNMGASTVFSATRFGNVLGSAGSVIPLFKRQIVHGGPVTITDKRIIRYFMTIPEASQLVLQSGAMAKNGELFVLDMGSPVKILDLAENMIKLSGYEPYRDIDILEIGLRPGEKLYEELLINTEELDATENKQIFIERDKPVLMTELNEKLAILKSALEKEDDYIVKAALMETVPTFHSPEVVNTSAADSKEMKIVFEKSPTMLNA